MTTKRSRAFWAWASMKQRCKNPKHKEYHNYGGRGIIVCERWEKFRNFSEDMGEPGAGLSLDRINNNGNYEPGNCRWATPAQQMQNRRNYASKVKRTNSFIEFGGMVLTQTQWAERIGLDRGTLRWRIRHNWDIEKALTTKSRRHAWLSAHTPTGKEK